MNTSNQETMFPAWVKQLSDPSAWKAWMQNPPTELLQMKPQFPEISASLDPDVMQHLQQDYMLQFSALWQGFVESKVPEISDKRFTSPAWHANPLAAFNAAAYLLNSRFMLAMADAVQAPPKAKQKIRFSVQQMIDAASPANFLATNPEALQKIAETKGDSLVKGIEHLLADMKKGHISQTDESAFEVGKNVASTEGAVVFENALFQLIQYKSLTKKVHERPLLLVPPCINKYYILDLQADNSLVRYAVDQGNTVFLISWCNPDATLGQTTWDQYIDDAVIKAIEVAQEISGQDKINALGFCVGGTLLSTAAAVLTARGKNPLSSLTLLTSMLDFSETGILDVFIDEAQVAMREQTIGTGGLMPGRDFSSAFSSLRANDLVWNYVGSNYLKGENPPPFDLLYWNADSTNLPGPMFCWYLRNTYLENSLKVPGKLTVAGEKVDLRKINAPTFIYGSREDHIVPWQSAYASTALLNPKKPSQNRFILGASGHIAGVINAPTKNKRNYWTNDNNAADADTWFAGATSHPGSWWPEWSAFLASHGGKDVTAPRQYGSKAYQAIEPAPGRYVKVKADM